MASSGFFNGFSMVLIWFCMLLLWPFRVSAMVIVRCFYNYFMFPVWFFWRVVSEFFYGSFMVILKGFFMVLLCLFKTPSEGLHLVYLLFFYCFLEGCSRVLLWCLYCSFEGFLQGIVCCYLYGYFERVLSWFFRGSFLVLLKGVFSDYFGFFRVPRVGPSKYHTRTIENIKNPK